MEPAAVRIYLTGRPAIEAKGIFLGADRFPGQQGRVAFAYLVLERGRIVTRAELADVLWPGDLPPAWETALSAIMSKLRALLTNVSSPMQAALSSTRGAYELRLPVDTWIDAEAAADAIHEAESALRGGEPRRAYGPSAVAHHIARRPFLPGEQGAWIEGRRDRLREIHLRALEVRAEVYLWNGEGPLALQSARELIGLQPFREAGHRLVMRAHAALGNTAEALQSYETCRKLIARELGVDPSPQTKAVHEQLLHSLRTTRVTEGPDPVQ